jgi:hypothetical protein
MGFTDMQVEKKFEKHCWFLYICKVKELFHKFKNNIIIITLLPGKTKFCEALVGDGVFLMTKVLESKTGLVSFSNRDFCNSSSSRHEDSKM